MGFARGAAARAAVAGMAASGMLAIAPAASAEPQVVVQCDGPLAEGMKFTAETNWKPFPNPDRSVTITRNGGRFTLELAGEAPYTSGAVLTIPMENIRTFKVLRSGGSELFHLEKGEGGKPILKHTIRGGRDGTGKYNIRETILANCTTVGPGVAVSEPQASGAGG